MYVYIYIYIEEQRTIFIKTRGALACALAQENCGFGDDFVGSYGSEGVFFGRRQVFKLRPF